MAELTYKEVQEAKDKPFWIERNGVYIKGFDTKDQAEDYMFHNECDDCVICDKEK